MNIGEWHWAQLKRDYRIEDYDLLRAMGVAVSVTLPAGTLVYVIVKGSLYDNFFTLTLGPMTTVEYPFSSQTEFDTPYSDLLEPLE